MITLKDLDPKTKSQLFQIIKDNFGKDALGFAVAHNRDLGLKANTMGDVNDVFCTLLGFMTLQLLSDKIVIKTQSTTRS